MPVNIHGKEYLTVAERINAIHDNEDKLSIQTEILTYEGGLVVVKAVITTEAGVFTGHAYEVETGSGINKTSALENCETSAVGRALAFAGYAGSEIASANEVQNAIQQQQASWTAGAFSKRLQAIKTGFESAGLGDVFTNHLEANYGSKNPVDVVKNHLQDADRIIESFTALYKREKK